MEKKFIFLYPQEEIINLEISRGSRLYKDPQSEEKDIYYVRNENYII